MLTNAKRLATGVTALAAAVAVAAAGAPAASAKTTPVTFSKVSGDYQLIVKGKRSKVGSQKRFTNLKLTVVKNGEPGGLVNVKLTKKLSGESWSIRPYLFLKDVNGDAVPDAIVDVYTGGAHCCQVSSIALSTGPSSWSKPIVESWGGFYSLDDIDKNGSSEFVASDMRFDYAFTSHAGSALPIVIKAVQNGQLVDVTKSYPAKLRADADQWIASLNDVLKDSPLDDPEGDRQLHRSLLAAAVADLVRLGAIDEAKTLIAQAAARDDFKGEDDIWDTAVGKRLQEWGYVADYAALGFPK